MSRKLLQQLYPPNGCEVRRVVAWTLIAYGMVRLLQLPAAGHEVLTIAPGLVYGWLKVIVGIALLLTNYKRRLTWLGRIVAVFTFSLCVTMAIDSYPIWNGVATYALLGLFTLSGITSRSECDNDKSKEYFTETPSS